MAESGHIDGFKYNQVFEGLVNLKDIPELSSDRVSSEKLNTVHVATGVWSIAHDLSLNNNTHSGLREMTILMSV